jgi:hypothetical protein
MESNNNSNDFLFFTDFDIPKYSFLLIVFTLLTMLILFLRKRLKQYTTHRTKLKDMAEEYERKRKSRKSLLVNLLINLVSL